ncbi:hypothetical protein L2E82_47623 [Cichorium intybus]|uniref:Uncharacterized protein n=1 Tax=Cichorium intybus TaxID=13427 RepID=A0ACB8YX29_CICIN|nr:hypothetical protein L2E82_47623 [Cichorium intybus]
MTARDINYRPPPDAPSSPVSFHSITPHHHSFLSFCVIAPKIYRKRFQISSYQVVFPDLKREECKTYYVEALSRRRKRDDGLTSLNRFGSLALTFDVGCTCVDEALSRRRKTGVGWVGR